MTGPCSQRLMRDVRLHRKIEAFFRLGPRANWSIVAEMMDHVGLPASTFDYVLRAPAPDPDVIRALNGDAFPRPPLSVVPKGGMRRWFRTSRAGGWR